jgi:modulator of FtsH protease HflC
MRKVILGVIGGAVALVLLIVLCTFVKRPYEKVLLYRFGALIDEDQQSRIMYNWYWKLPTDKVVPFDNRLHLYTGALVEATTANSEPISVRAFAAWRIVDARKFYTTTGGSDETAQRQIATILQSLVQGNIPAHKLDEFFNTDETKIHTSLIEDDIARKATEDIKNPDGTVKTAGLGSMGIQIVEIGFSRIAFPPSNAVNVYQRMVAELNKKAIDYENQGLADANAILAEGKLAAETERAEALVKAASIRGQADAEALRTLAKVQDTPQAMEFYQYWKSLEFLKTSLAKNTILVLASNSDILKAMFQAPKNGPLPAAATGKAPAEEMGIQPAVTPQPGGK